MLSLDSMFEKLKTGEKSMMHQDSLEPAAIWFVLERLQESARRSGYFLPTFFINRGYIFSISTKNAQFVVVSVAIKYYGKLRLDL